ncbi:F420-dependent oxidoreductase-like protein [Thermasporomyces composti]|jgi:F420-dependent oxidoreductase-like protein|uniref:F420-dependent oxidoreductase-like protein n=2 Tax=Thermasporomyces composti TaxID=696763 RepID=A0A3D9V655_THECX|nr:F420-dependent oxidoreductase-like protein [Thermasporomyces composti]
MRVGIKLSPQHTTIDELRAVWRLADEAGFDSCWTFDHFASIGSDDPSGDVFEGWTLLAAMAEGTERVRIGCMVTGVTYRHPAVLAKIAVTVDHLSGGRLDFGLGAAWAEVEHQMLGLELGSLRERMDRFEEACQIITSLWTRPTTTFCGRYYRLTNALSNPKPVQRPYPPFWIGGSGRKRTLRITAQYADAWNASGGSPEEVAELSAVLDQHCADVGRDPSEIKRTVQLRYTGDADELLTTVERFAQVGIGEVIVILRGGEAIAQAEQVAALLPRLRAVG